MTGKNSTLPPARRADDTAGCDDPTLPLRPAPGLTQQAPRCAGEYVLGGVLAEGGFGVVHRAEHAARRTAAAVKIPHAELVAQPDILVRFEREIEVVRRLRHPNVVRVLDFGRLDDGRPYFAMELLSGIDLHAHLQARGRLPADEALAILEPVCSALEAAHAQGIVHRDIKPSNVFLVGDNGSRRVVLLDFGVAKLLDAPGPAITSSRHVVGTLSYMSPEQLSSRPVGPRTDVYAVGALLHAMLVGEPPALSAACPPMRQLLLHGSPLRPSLQAPVHPAFDEVVLRAMSHDPSARHPSIVAFMEHARWAAAQHRGTAGDRAESHRRRAFALYVEALADASALEAADTRLLEDLEGILPAAREHLAPAGLSLAIETGNGALFVTSRPVGPALDREVGRQVLDAALSLRQGLEGRACRDSRVRIHLSVHAGELLASDAGDLIGGELLELSAHIPENVTEGIFVSSTVLAGLEGVHRAAQPDATLVRIA